jgi:maltose O-acetyltransferase
VQRPRIVRRVQRDRIKHFKNNCIVTLQQETRIRVMPKMIGAFRRELQSLICAGLPFSSRCLLTIARCLPDFTMTSLRILLYRKAGFGFESGVVLLGALRLIGSGNLSRRLSIGQGSIIAPNVTFGLDNDITLGTNVSISPGAVLYTATHSIGFGSRRMSYSTSARAIVVEDGVWIGMQALILPGVTLGRGSVVAAGAVVQQDVPPNTLVAGNPAAVQHSLPFGDR